MTNHLLNSKWVCSLTLAYQTALWLNGFDMWPTTHETIRMRVERRYLEYAVTQKISTKHEKVLALGWTKL